jgi:hypothetical protein
MSDSEPDEAAEKQLTLNIVNLADVLEVELDRGMITEMKFSHGGVVRMFLRDCAVDHPKVETVLVAAAPSGSPKERSDALYAALDHIVKRRS